MTSESPEPRLLLGCQDELITLAEVTVDNTPNADPTSLLVRFVGG